MKLHYLVVKSNINQSQIEMSKKIRNSKGEMLKVLEIPKQYWVISWNFQINKCESTIIVGCMCLEFWTHKTYNHM
jgi:hypothetical protein